ncbi:MAG: MarC family protein [Bacteroidota bacterium]
MTLKAILSVTLILFSVMDIIGSLPVIINMKRDGIKITPSVVTLCAGILMITFLFFGTSLLDLFGIRVSSFALAGSLVIFFIGLEMTLGIRFFRKDLEEEEDNSSGSIVPVAFPLLAGAGTLTTIISLKADFNTPAIIIGIIVNLLIVFAILHATPWLSKKMTPTLSSSLRKVFGILLIAIAIEMVVSNI